MAGVLRYVALTGSPAATGTSAGLAAYRFTHNPEASLKLAVLAGVLTFVSLVALALAQLAESWICHRSEHHFSYTLKPRWRTRAMPRPGCPSREFPARPGGQQPPACRLPGGTVVSLVRRHRTRNGVGKPVTEL